MRKRGQSLFAVAVGADHAMPLALVLLLSAEVIYLMLRFEMLGLFNSPSIWAQLIGWSPQYVRVAIAIAAATLLLGRGHLLATLRVTPSGPFARSRFLYLAAHGCALMLFIQVCDIVTGGDFLSLPYPPVWTFAWFLSGGAALAAWAGAAFPVRSWFLTAKQVRHELGIGAVLGMTVWAASLVTQQLWTSLAHYTFRVVEWMLTLLYPAIVSDSVRLVVGTPTFKVVIAPHCSGYEGVGLILVFLLAYLWLFRRELRFPAAFALLPLGAATIWLLNALRIVALIIIGTSGWREIAIGGFHSQAGWLAFNVIALGIAVITTHGGYFAKTREPAAAIENQHDPTPYLAPLITILATAMVTGAMTAGFDWLYPVRVVAVGSVLWCFRKRYRQLPWRFSAFAVAIGSVAFLLWLVLFPAGPNAGADWPASLRSVSAYAAAAWLLSRLFGYIVLVPIAEELAFRGFLRRRIFHRDFQTVPMGVFSWMSFLVSSVLFGALHGRSWVAGTVVGMLFALALYRRGSLGDAVLAHATTNALIVFYVFATGNWSVWS